jgi:hypothetical protein
MVKKVSQSIPIYESKLLISIIVHIENTKLSYICMMGVTLQIMYICMAEAMSVSISILNS